MARAENVAGRGGFPAGSPPHIVGGARAPAFTRPVMKLTTLLYSFSALAMALWLYLFHSGATI